MLSYEVKAMAMLKLAIDTNSHIICLLTQVISLNGKAKYEKVIQSIETIFTEYKKNIDIIKE